LEDNNAPYINDQDALLNLGSHNYENENNNINIASLNNVFFSLTKNMESMYHVVRSICLPNNENVLSFSHSRLSRNINEQ